MNRRLVHFLIIGAVGAVTIGTLVFKLLRPGHFGAAGWIVFVVCCLLSVNDGSVRILTTSGAQFDALLQTERFRRGFWLWFCIGFGFFVAANLIGYSPGKIRFHGMPLEFYPSFGGDILAVAALVLDLAFGLAHSYLGALGMAWARADQELTEKHR